MFVKTHTSAMVNVLLGAVLLSPSSSSNCSVKDVAEAIRDNLRFFEESQAHCEKSSMFESFRETYLRWTTIAKGMGVFLILSQAEQPATSWLTAVSITIR